MYIRLIKRKEETSKTVNKYKLTACFVYQSRTALLIYLFTLRNNVNELFFFVINHDDINIFQIKHKIKKVCIFNFLFVFYVCVYF